MRCNQGAIDGGLPALPTELRIFIEHPTGLEPVTRPLKVDNHHSTDLISFSKTFDNKNHDQGVGGRK